MLNSCPIPRRTLTLADRQVKAEENKVIRHFYPLPDEPVSSWSGVQTAF